MTDAPRTALYNAAELAAHRSAFRRGFVVQCRVIGAILMRELHTRFGRDNIGYLWMFVEPMLLAGAVSGMHLASHSTVVFGMEVVPFYLTGYTPYVIFRQTINRAAATIESNRTLLYHRQITLFDLLLARSLLDLIGVTLAMITLIAGAAALGLASLPDRPILMFASLLLMFWISFALSLPICAWSAFSNSVERLVHPMTYLMLPLSGVFFVAEQVPSGWRDFVLWGPVLHITELCRMGQFGQFNSKYIDIPYVLVWCILLTVFGMLAIRSVKSRIFEE